MLDQRAGTEPILSLQAVLQVQGGEDQGEDIEATLVGARHSRQMTKRRLSFLFRPLSCLCSAEQYFLLQAWYPLDVFVILTRLR